jgi:hypothetical protein
MKTAEHNNVPFAAEQIAMLEAELEKARADKCGLMALCREAYYLVMAHHDPKVMKQDFCPVCARPECNTLLFRLQSADIPQPNI